MDLDTIIRLLSLWISPFNFSFYLKEFPLSFLLKEDDIYKSSSEKVFLSEESSSIEIILFLPEDCFLLTFNVGFLGKGALDFKEDTDTRDHPFFSFKEWEV